MAHQPKAVLGGSTFGCQRSEDTCYKKAKAIQDSELPLVNCPIRHHPLTPNSVAVSVG